jgi:hypothetical protein
MANHIEDDEDDEIPSAEEPRKDFSGIIEKVKNYLKEYYVPAYDPGGQGVLHYTTGEIYAQLQRLVPGADLYTTTDVALWLHDAGFTFYDYGEMKFEWMLKKVVNS